MAVSPDMVDYSQEHVFTPPVPILPLRRSRSVAESVAWHTQASGLPIEQVVSIWAQQKGAGFVEEMLYSAPYT